MKLTLYYLILIDIIYCQYRSYIIIFMKYEANPQNFEKIGMFSFYIYLVYLDPISMR